MFKLDTNELEGVSVKPGFPNPAADLVLDNPNFNRLLVRHPSATFCFQLEGNDWAGEGMFSGDIVVVDRALDPTKTDVVIWVRDGSFVISKFNKVTDDSQTWGVVTAVIHQLKS